MLERLDALDISILNSLTSDARTPFTEIAKDLNVSSGTIHVRIRKMETMGIITTSRLNVNYRALNIEVIAYVFLRMLPQASIESIMKDLRRIPEVVTTELVTGAQQLIAKLICTTRQRYNEIITNVFPSFEGIVVDQHALVLDELIDRPLELNDPMANDQSASS